ncbi:hypothetical protein SAMN05444365_103288 [Micromonospora pattaloongensis]|uniref:Uncharacterized protein n=1 Tax=Micromonospora pattaloongensis TaxID=405436 RepID=A0A1H3MBH9_9ACTN|nr:hypothetical protein [Micromonospora pattaloongensis]SDY73365.1 hypothetical protein SAMN05444365_103288 [Micromonospora pattaloongensis]
MTAEELQRQVELLIRQVAHWEAPRWAARAGTGDVSRAELMHALVQRLADRAAGAEGEPHRRVPRLDNDLVLPDQLRVLTADLVAAHPPPPVLATSAADVVETRRAL